MSEFCIETERNGGNYVDRGVKLMVMFPAE